MIVLDFDEVYEAHFRESNIETEEDLANLEFTWCDGCRSTTGIHLTDRESLMIHGFTTKEAPYGICISCALDYDKLDVRLKEEEFCLDTDLFYKEEGKTLATPLTRKKLTEEQVSEEKERGRSRGQFRDFSNRYNLKSLYRSALTEDRYRKMDPPYFIGNRLRYHGMDRFQNVEIDDVRSNYDLANMRVERNNRIPESDAERPTPMEFRRDWFDSLLDSFILHEKHNEGKPNKRLAYALICTYLHKSWDWNNIEPLWVFAKRMGIGNVQLKSKMNDWINPIPDYHVTQMESLSNVPSFQTITNLVGVITEHSHDVMISFEEKQELTQQSISLLNQLSNVKIKVPVGKTSVEKTLLNHIHSVMKFNGSFSIQGQELCAAGAIEALCISYCATNVLGKQRRNVLHRKFLFPKGNGVPWWKQELTTDAVHIISSFDKIIDKFQT